MKKELMIWIILILTLAILIFGCAEKTVEEQSEEIETQPEPVLEETPEEIPEEETIHEEIVIKDEGWPTFHGDAARTGYSTSKAPSKPNILWKWGMEDFKEIGIDPIDANRPIINNDKVFFALEEGILAADLKTGKVTWKFLNEGSAFPWGLTSGDGKIFAIINADNDLYNLPPGFIYAFDENTGKFLWKFQTKKGISHSLPLFADNKIFVGDDSGTIYALDTKGGLVWKKQLSAEKVHSSPAFKDGIIFVGTEGSQRSNKMPSYLYALKAVDGSELWKFQIDYLSGKLNLIHSTPAISDNVYFGAENGYFYAVSNKDGKLIWKQKIASGSEELIGVSAAAAVGYGKVFIGTYEGKFLALNQKDGKTVWEYNFGKANADSSPVLADNKVYFGVGEGGDGYFYCFDANNGEVIWKEKLGGSSAALSSGILIVINKLAEENLKPETPIVIAYS